MAAMILMKGENLGFDDCFRRYYKTLCYFAVRILSVHEEAEEVVQEVFIRLFEEKRTFADEEHLRRFLYMAVRNDCLNRMKLQRIHAGILEKFGAGQEEAGADAFVEIVRSEVYERIMKAVEGLPKECGRVFRMAYMEGMDNEEVAGRLGISVNTVKSQKNKAKTLLRGELKDLYPMAVLLLALA
ncbi:MAG: RNA polymerase sigma-70 factor [Odoribacter sp.]|nr:RNA polymerase sigma-70 factor [Odoribacter sp.]